MSQWAGQVTIVDRRGRIVAQGRATLESKAATGRPSWTGVLRPAGFLSVDANELYEVRLPGGRSGNAFVTVGIKRSAEGAAEQSGILRGAGPAPF